MAWAFGEVDEAEVGRARADSCADRVGCGKAADLDGESGHLGALACVGVS